MSHDPLCRFSRKRAADDKYDDCEYCDLIAKVRADERYRLFTHRVMSDERAKH